MKGNFEVSCEGLIGPNHNFGGLSIDNKAAQKNKGGISNPKLAALQGLEKMWLLAKNNTPVVVFPPAKRPNIKWLSRINGKIDQLQYDLESDAIDSFLERGCFSSAQMYMANSATVCASSDSGDGKVHFLPANLNFSLHRSYESIENIKIFRKIFADERYFTIHDVLPQQRLLSDEGAANHFRFSSYDSTRSHNLFGYGSDNDIFTFSKIDGSSFLTRQTLLASVSACKKMGIIPGKASFLKQSEISIRAGIFHVDGILINNANIVIYHEHTFDNSSKLEELFNKLDLSGFQMRLVKIDDKLLPIRDAASSFVLNSQLVSGLGENKMLITTEQTFENPAAKKTIDFLANKIGISKQNIEILDMSEILKNGGGPSCLRLRIPLRAEEFAAINKRFLLTADLYLEIKNFISTNYRDRLSLRDFADPLFITELSNTFDNLHNIFGIGLYE